MKKTMSFHPKRFKTKLIGYNLVIILCIAAAISIYNYKSYRKTTILHETTNSQAHISQIASRIDLAYNEMINIVQNCAERQSLFLNTQTNHLDSPAAKQFSLYSAVALRDYRAMSGYNQYISKLMIYQKHSFLLETGTSYGSFMDSSEVMSADWFQSSLALSISKYPLSLVKSPFMHTKIADEFILPIVRPLQYHVTASPSEDAWVFLAISPSLFHSILQSANNSQSIFITTKDGDLVSSLNDSGFTIDALTTRLLRFEQSAGSFSEVVNGQECVITWHKLKNSGFLIFEILPLEKIALDKAVIKNTIIYVFLACIGIGVFLSLLISYQLGKPITLLNHRLDNIAGGQFDSDHSIESDDEFGDMGRHINHMSTQLSLLMENRIQMEKEKSHLELKMLQAQINPHFLYNTLDSIKWIATMQRNSGIVQMVTSLSGLLKNMAKGYDEKVTLRQELDFLKDYINIEKVRYLELFDVETLVEDNLYEAQIIKLTLQPLVENAIFSGIEPSGRNGIIKIHAFCKDDNLCITVTDNGIGIPAEKIPSILKDSPSNRKNSMSGIGVTNVNRRIHLNYGEAYGLSIDSVLDEYTMITITLPFIMSSNITENIAQGNQPGTNRQRGEK